MPTHLCYLTYGGLPKFCLRYKYTAMSDSVEDEEEEALFYDLVLSQTVHTLRLAISKDSKGKLGESPLWPTTLQQEHQSVQKWNAQKISRFDYLPN